MCISPASAVQSAGIIHMHHHTQLGFSLYIDREPTTTVPQSDGYADGRGHGRLYFIFIISVGIILLNTFLSLLKDAPDCRVQAPMFAFFISFFIKQNQLKENEGWYYKLQTPANLRS